MRERRNAIMVDEDLHEAIKVVAARKRISMKQFLNEMFEFYINNKNKESDNA